MIASRTVRHLRTVRGELADAEQRARYEADVAAQAIARAETAERERDALKIEVTQLRTELQQALNPTPRPAPSWKGVTYRDGCWIDADGVAHISAARCIDQNDPGADETFKQERLTDADHAELLKLRDEAERVATVESVVREFASASRDGLHEVEQATLCNMLRTAFGDFDAPRDVDVESWGMDKHHAVAGWCWHDHGGIGIRTARRDVPESAKGTEFPVFREYAPRALTAAECVERLVALGAVVATCRYGSCVDDVNISSGQRVVILPTEVAQ